MGRRPELPRGDAWRGAGIAWTMTAELLAAILVWGLIGAGMDRLVGTGKLFLAIGMVLGAATGIYLVYVKHGRDE
ncbi:MAG TPA: AtpZ/AtpI family protein [Actinomycetota bacterium]|nr:AtpZ/AtpI family protein [Actinomycetota bacterium]